MSDLHETFLKAKENEKQKEHDAQTLRCLACHFFDCRCFKDVKPLESQSEYEHVIRQH